MNENIIWILIFISILFILVVIVKDLFFICDSSDRKILKEKNINAFGDVSRYVARSRETIPDVTYYCYNTSNDKLTSIDREKIKNGIRSCWWISWLFWIIFSYRYSFWWSRIYWNSFTYDV